MYCFQHYWTKENPRNIHITVTDLSKVPDGADCYAKEYEVDELDIDNSFISDWGCFRSGFLEMLLRIEPSKICWHDRIPDWVRDFYSVEDIIRIAKRHTAVKEKEMRRVPCLF